MAMRSFREGNLARTTAGFSSAPAGRYAPHASRTRAPTFLLMHKNACRAAEQQSSSGELPLGLHTALATNGTGSQLPPERPAPTAPPAFPSLDQPSSTTSSAPPSPTRSTGAGRRGRRSTSARDAPKSLGPSDAALVNGTPSASPSSTAPPEPDRAAATQPSGSPHISGEGTKGGNTSTPGPRPRSAKRPRTAPALVSVDTLTLEDKVAGLAMLGAVAPGGDQPSAPGPGVAGPLRQRARIRTVTKPLPRVLFLHTGGTLGMDPESAFEEDESHNLRARAGLTESSYKGSLGPGEMLSSLLTMVPELERFANVDLTVLFNKDSSRVGPADWVRIARALHAQRQHYDAFVVVHGTDTLAYTAAALSLMLSGFKKPIILTGSQLPLRAPRSDARQNLLDSIQVATSAFSPPHVSLEEVAVCFGGKLMRGNRTQKVHSAAYQAFDSPTYPHLATLGIDVDWNRRVLLRVEGAYKPRFKLDPRVIRIPVVPGSDPRTAYGDLYGRGVRGVVLEAFGVGNLPDQSGDGWLPWLKDQTAKGLQVCLASQCVTGPLQPALYRAGQLAAQMGVEAGPSMTPECAAVKLMFCLRHPDLALGVPLAGEL